MKKIEGSLHNVQRYQYDGMTIRFSAELDRAGAYLYVAELRSPDFRNETQKIYLLQRTLMFAAFKENQRVILSVSENSRQMKAFELLRGLPYMIKTDQPIAAILKPSAQNTFVSGTVLDVHVAKTRLNALCEKIFWLLILACPILIWFVLSK